MRKVLLFSLLTLVSAMPSMAVNAPTGVNGQTLGTIDFVGARYTNIDASTGATVIIANSTGTNGISKGSAILYGVIASSISQGDYLIFRDTTGVGASGTYLAPQSTLTTFGSVIGTAAIVSNFLLPNSTFTTQFPYPLMNIITFPAPIQFQYGIQVQASAAPTANGGASRWTLIYRDLNSSNR